ncbi:AbrB family transcriptional regulator [Betaproteobacteria bacterium]|nr:AbrB family transcriptional regulator [Betaproteobacteria bacterium]
MSTLHELATITSKGQITLPKPIRQMLGVGVGDQVAFDLRENGDIVVSQAAALHEDPAIGGFLDLLAADIQAGHVRDLPEDLSKALLKYSGHDVDLDEPIVGDVVI